MVSYFFKRGIESLPFLSQLVLSKSFDLLSSTWYVKTICKTCKTAFYHRSIKRPIKFCLKFIFIGFVLSKVILTPTSWSQKAAQTERHTDCKKPSVCEFIRPREGRKVWRDRPIVFREVQTNLVEKTIGNYDAKLEAIKKPKQEVSPVLETLVPLRPTLPCSYYWAIPLLIPFQHVNNISSQLGGCTYCHKDNS